MDDACWCHEIINFTELLKEREKWYQQMCSYKTTTPPPLPPNSHNAKTHSTPNSVNEIRCFKKPDGNEQPERLPRLNSLFTGGLSWNIISSEPTRWNPNSFFETKNIVKHSKSKRRTPPPSPLQKGNYCADDNTRSRFQKPPTRVVESIEKRERRTFA